MWDARQLPRVGTEGKRMPERIHAAILLLFSPLPPLMESPTVLSAIVNAGCTLFIQIKESLMYVEHPDFQLRDRGLKISRYFSLHKFTDLLQSKQAYFARADQFRDQSEGVWSKAEVEYKLASCATRQRYEVTAATERIS